AAGAQSWTPEPQRRLESFLRQLANDPDLDVVPEQLYQLVADWLGVISMSQPVMFVVDDMQWATELTAATIDYLVAAGPPIPVLLLLTERRSAEERLPAPAHDRTVVDLSPLSSDEVGQLIAEAAGPTGDLTTDMATLIDKVEGNPLLALHLAASER